MIDPHLPPEQPPQTTPQILRQFAGIWLVSVSALASYQWLARADQILAIVLAMVAVVVGVAGLVKPAMIRPLFTSLMVITYPIGWVVSYLLLGFLYYGVFTPVALLFRLIHRDALTLRRPARLESYWVPKPTTTDVRSYLRQS